MNSHERSSTSPIFLSEIFPLSVTKPNLARFRLSPEVGREIGNRLSWRFSQRFPDIVAIWQQEYFWILGKLKQARPEPAEWRNALTEICEELKEEIGDRDYAIQWVREPEIVSSILAQLAVRVLKITRPFSSRVVLTENQVEVKREVKLWAEEIKETKQYGYAMAALRPCVTPDTANRFEVDYGKLLKATKISYQERQNCLKLYKKEAGNVLRAYGFEFGQKSINSVEYPALFWQPKVNLKETRLLFGNGVTGFQGKILTGLSKGGVYRRHEDFQDQSQPIHIASLKLCDLKVGAFLNEAQKRLKLYKFESLIPPENKKAVSVENLPGVEARTKVEEAVDELMEMHPDIVLVFLPTSDRNADEQEGGSLYSWIYSRLLRRGIASQVIYEDTLRKVEIKYLLNQVIPGILAKLGNLPFVLAEPLEIADYFIGLDISRGSKKRNVGTMNACASVRLYGKQGEFIRYRLEDALIEGEEIPQRILETFLPAAQLKEKTVLIYRDGRFCGSEVSLESLVETTLKLTLLHHGSLKEPRLPVPLFGSDRIAYRRLQGIAPGLLEGDRQFWL